MKDKLKQEAREELSKIMTWIKVQPHEDYTDAIINLLEKELDKVSQAKEKEFEEILNSLRLDESPRDPFTGEAVETYGYETTHNQALKMALQTLKAKKAI
jgi:hypothetical protein